MAKPLMYCSEQIAIPDTFPNILKDYAKAVIRTQPYDLLRWSAAYFRSLAQNETPPAKCRLEKTNECGIITKGYLRVLLDQVGKGFFISREVLQQKWEGLCLPEDTLLTYLSVCRMLNWPQVHWLKLFAVMVGSLNETPTGTLTMLCELLTDDVEGGPAKIPVWMLRTVYTFISELDCSEEQIFMNGRRKLSDGTLESETVMDNVPKVFSSSSLKKHIMEECMQRYNETCQRDSDSMQSFKIANIEDQRPNTPSDDISSSTTVDSGFQFFGKPGDTKQIITKCGDFDSLILLLRESQGAKLHDYEGPYHISQANIEHAKRREAQSNADRELQEVKFLENTRKFLHQENVNLLREMGPPWSWIHQFVNNSCVDMSYNFIEEGSIASDVTPPESSDESFDFAHEKPISGNESESDTHIFSTTTDSPDELIKAEKVTAQPTDNRFDAIHTIQTMHNVLMKAESSGEICADDTSSILSYLNKDEMGVLFRAGERSAPGFHIEVLEQILRQSMDNGVRFDTIDEVVKYVKRKYIEFTKDTQIKYFGESGYYQTLQADEKLVSDHIREEELSEEQSAEEIKKEEECEVESHDSADESEKEEKAISLGKLSLGIVKGPVTDDEEDDEKASSAGETIPEPLEIVKEQATGTLQNIAEIKTEESIDISGLKGMEDVFDTCGIEADPKLLNTKLPDEMILGLIDKDSVAEPSEEGAIQSTLTATEDASSLGGYMSDVSNTLTTPQSTEREIKPPAFLCGLDAETKNQMDSRAEYTCRVLAYPGIGKSTSKKTMQDFLTYLKFRSRTQKGMVMPRNFREEKCPKMFD